MWCYQWQWRGVEGAPGARIPVSLPSLAGCVTLAISVSSLSDAPLPHTLHWEEPQLYENRWTHSTGRCSQSGFSQQHHAQMWHQKHRRSLDWIPGLSSIPVMGGLNGRQVVVLPRGWRNSVLGVCMNTPPLFIYLFIYLFLSF